MCGGDSTGSWEAPLQSLQRSSVCGGWGWGDQGPSQSRCQEESEATEPPLSTLGAAGPHTGVRSSPSELLSSSKSTDPGSGLRQPMWDMSTTLGDKADFCFREEKQKNTKAMKKTYATQRKHQNTAGDGRRTYVQKYVQK